MIFVPFIFFLLLTVFFVKRQKRFGICSYMSGLFAVVSFFSILIVKLGLTGEAGVLFSAENMHLGFLPTLLYCLLITLAIIPFSRVDGLENKEISVRSEKLFVAFCIFLLLLAALNFYLAVDNVINLIENGTWMSENKYTKNGYPSYSGLWALRTTHYNGCKSLSDIRLERLPKVFGYIYYLHNCTILLVPCFFYSLCCTNKKWWFNLLLLLGSISVPYLSIQRADRTEIVNYVIMFVLCIVFFWRVLKRKQWVFMGIVLAPIVFAATFYLVGVTKARFHTSDNGELKGFVQYAGQSYPNFCYVYENAHRDTIYYERVFPMTGHFVFDNNYDINAGKKRSEMHGFKADVFYSFLGTILLDFGKFPMILWTLAFAGLCMLFFRGKNSDISFWKVLIIFALAEVPVFGIFYYRYYYYDLAMVFWVALGFFVLSEKDWLKGKILKK